MDLTLAALCERLAEHGILIKPTALWHQLDKWNLTFKKTLRASEHERDDIKQARATWQEHQPALDVAKPIFIDETGATTHMPRARGRSPKGARCHASVPGGHWKTTTFIAGLRVGAITAPMVLDGSMDQAAFLVYVCECLCPTLHPGDIVIADNLRSHKNEAVRTAIEAVGATIRYLPPYSPDFNPIEMVFAKLEALLTAFSPTECAHYFHHAGYAV